MKWNNRRDRRPRDGWDVNRQSGYEWDEEDSEFSYEDVSEEDDENGVFDGPEFIDVELSSAGDGEVEFETLDETEESTYARETEYVSEYDANVSDKEYAQEPEYEAEHSAYVVNAEYAQEPDLDFEQDDRDLDAMGNFGSGKPVRMNAEDGVEFATDYARDEGYDTDDDGYLPELTEEDLKYGYGGELLGTDYGYGDGNDSYLEPDLNLGSVETIQSADEEYDPDDDWKDDSIENDPYLNGSDEEMVEDDQQNENAVQWNEVQEQSYSDEKDMQKDLGDTMQIPDAQSFGEYDGEILYIEDEEDGERGFEDEVQPQPIRNRERSGSRTSSGRTAYCRKDSIGLFEKITLVAGVVVIVLLIGFIGIVVWSGKSRQGQSDNEFAEVGMQIRNIDLIGGQGILAVANAEIERLTPELDPLEESEVETGNENPQNNTDYNENDYKTTVKVSMTMVSVQKDLKIKFSNKETSKLIGNVKFVVEATKPDGTVEEWTDTDMDGIIYQEGIADGKYSISLKELDEDKYSNYILPASAQTVTVKKNIEYVKVDVTGEAKKENEINVGQEDTKKNETTNESSLTDTVVWVSSSVTGNTYTEVLKSTVPDPLTLPIQVTKRNFFRTTMRLKPDPEDDLSPIEAPTPTEGPAPTEEPAPTEGPAPTETPAPTSTPEATPVPTPTPEATPVPTPTPEATPVPTPTPEVTPVPTPSALPMEKTDMELDAANINLTVTRVKSGTNSFLGKTIVTAKGVKYLEGKKLKYEAVSANEAIATVTPKENEDGKFTITAVGAGMTQVMISVDYQDQDKIAGVDSKVTKTINVTITEKEKEALTIGLDKTEVLCYSEVADAPIVLVATISNSTKKAAELVEANMSFQAESSDTNVMQITKKEFVPSTVDGTVQVRLTIAPQTLTERKSAFVQVKYTEGEEDVTVKCAVTVKPHPKNDRSTPLLDKEGRPLFVMESSDKYRQAVYADYYVEGIKFFVQSGVKYTGWQTLDGKTYYFNAEGQAVTGEQVIQGAKYQFGPDGVLMSGQGVLGIDVSKWNGSINWTSVKNSGVSYVIIRCGFRGSTGGKICEDSKFAANIKGATDAGLKVGVYFFTQAVNEREAVYEASYVLERIKNYKITYPVFLDVEPSGGRGDKIDKDTRTKVCKAFCQTIQNSGYTAGIYANKTWLNEKINTSELSGYRIWLAQYAATPTYDGKYDMWQYKSTGTVNGISGNVDMNLSYMGY